MIARDPAPTGANGVVTFTGTADPGSTLLVGLQRAGGFTAIGTATADSAGAWRFSIPAGALGYGTVTLATAALSPDWQPGPWTDATGFAFADPMDGLRHVGTGLAESLARDASQGLDATADLQALADLVLSGDGSPAVLDIPAGTYRISATLFLHSGTYIDAPGVTLIAADDFTRPAPDDRIGYALIANANYAADDYTDHDIQVRNLAFDWNGFTNFGSTAIRFRSVQNVMVQGASFNGGEDGTAFMHADGAVVRDSTATGTVNYAYDNWEGPRNTFIGFNTAAVDQRSGIALTARGTHADEDHTTANLAVVGNTITGAEWSGIQLEALSTASSLDGAFIAGNTIDGPGIGIALSGPGTADVLYANTLSGSLARPEIMLANNRNASSATAGWQVAGAVVAGNTVLDATIRQASTAAIQVTARDSVVYGNSVTYGGAPWSLWLDGDGLVSGGNALYGWTRAAVLQTGTGSITSTDTPGATASPAAGQLPYVLSAGTLAPQGGGVLDLRANADYALVTDVTLSGGAGQVVYLGPGAGVRVTVTGSGGVTLYGAAAADDIALGDGDDLVVLGGTAEVVDAGGGDDLLAINAVTARATIAGGPGQDRLLVTGGGTVTLGPAITGIEDVRILRAAAHTKLVLNALPGLSATAASGGDTLVAGGPDQVLVAGAGADLLAGLPGGPTTFAGRAAELSNDLLVNVGFGTTIDITSVGIGNAGFTLQADGTVSVLAFGDASDGGTLQIQGALDGTRFHVVADPLHGMALIYAPGIFTAGSGDDLTHVFGLLATATDPTQTLDLGGAVRPTGTLSLTAGIAPLSLPAGIALLLDGQGRSLDAAGHQGLDVAAGAVTLQDVTLLGGPALIGPAATLTLGADVAGALSFAGRGGTLALAPGIGFPGSVGGLSGGVAFDAMGIGAATADYDPASAILTIAGTGGSQTLRLVGLPAHAGFATAPDADGTGTLVTLVACYCRGTRIATPAGEVPIERLRVGDTVLLAAGGGLPIRWIGRRAHAAAEVAANPQLRPVRIRAHAVAEGQPARDLLVSATHAIAVDGTLVVAGALVNDASILREPPGAVTYFHIELARHALILAEGLPAESFADIAGRGMFDNAPRGRPAVPA